MNERAVELFTEGHSAATIARVLSKEFEGWSLTRNAVCGKLSRMGLTRNGVRTTPPKSPKLPRARTATIRKRAPNPTLPPYEGPVGPVGDFPDRGKCLWVFGDPLVSFQCCGRPIFKGSWCVHHSHAGSTSSEGPKPEFSLGKQGDRPQRLQSSCGLQPLRVSRSPKQASRF